MSALAIVEKLLIANPAIKKAASVYPIGAPQEARPPYMVLNIVGGSDELTLGGSGRYFEHRISVTSTAVTGTVAVNLGELAIQTLAIEKQTIGKWTDIDVYLAPVDLTQEASDRSAFARVTHFYVRWRERS